jgi:hypothetical protein
MKNINPRYMVRPAFMLIAAIFIAQQVFADSALRKCAGIAYDASRLVCFDALASVFVSADERRGGSGRRRPANRRSG